MGSPVKIELDPEKDSTIYIFDIVFIIVILYSINIIT